MKDMLLLLAHLLTTIAKLLGPGGAKAVVADSLLLKHQLLIINRSRRRSPNLLAHDRFLLGLWSLFLTSPRILRTAIIIRPSTLLKFHKALVRRKYRLIFSSIRRSKLGPKGPSGKVSSRGDRVANKERSRPFRAGSTIRRLPSLRMIASSPPVQIRAGCVPPDFCRYETGEHVVQFVAFKYPVNNQYMP